MLVPTSETLFLGTQMSTLWPRGTTIQYQIPLHGSWAQTQLMCLTAIMRPYKESSSKEHQRWLLSVFCNVLWSRTTVPVTWVACSSRKSLEVDQTSVSTPIQKYDGNTGQWQNASGRYVLQFSVKASWCVQVRPHLCWRSEECGTRWRSCGHNSRRPDGQGQVWRSSTLSTSPQCWQYTLWYNQGGLPMLCHSSPIRKYRNATEDGLSEW